MDVLQINADAMRSKNSTQRVESAAKPHIIIYLGPERASLRVAVEYALDAQTIQDGTQDVGLDPLPPARRSACARLIVAK